MPEVDPDAWTEQDGKGNEDQDEPSPEVEAVDGMLWLHPDDINWPAIRMTSEHDAASAASLATSMAEGQEEAVGVVLLEDGTYEGASGMNRCIAARAAGKQILCHVRKGSHRDVVRANIATATNQGRTNPRTEVEAITSAINNDGWTVPEMVQVTGKSVEWVEDRLRISGASPVVLQFLGDGRIAIGHANLVARLEQHADQEEVMHKILQGNWTVGQLENYLKPKPEAASPRTQSPGSGGKLPPL